MSTGVIEIDGDIVGERTTIEDGVSRDRPGGIVGARTPMTRSVALVGPLGAGKTTLLEAILVRTGAIERAGSVAAGTSVGDASPEARAHKMSTEINVAETSFLDDHYTFLDCPGSPELLCECAGPLAAVDVAVVVCEADERKMPALQVYLKDLEERGIPRMLFLNKIDRTEGGIRHVLEVLQHASRTPLVLRQIPIWADGIATGFIDLALERAFVYQEHAASSTVVIPDDDKAREVEARFHMLERVADYDDALLEELLSDIEPPRDRIFDDLAREMRDGLICPVFLGSAERGHGILRLLKALRHEAPGVVETRNRLGLGNGGETVVQVIKTVHSAHAGKLAIARVLAGHVADGTTLTRADGESGRVSGIFRIHGGAMTRRGPVAAGEVAALAKLEITRTGSTLSTARASAVDLVECARPQPCLSVAIAAVETRDDAKVATALHRLEEEDLGLSVASDAASGEIRLCGQGEMHLRIALERLTNRTGLTVTQRPPSIAYRETLRGPAAARARHKKQSGGHGQFADVAIEIEPAPRDAGFRFEDRTTGGVVPRQYAAAVEEGAREALAAGPSGFPVVDAVVRLTDGATHAVDSSEQAFRMAAIMAMREAMERAGTVLLEPVLAIEIACPSDATSRVNQIVTGRRGQITGFEPRAGWPGWDVVRAFMPEAETAGFVVELRSATAGVGSFEHRFDHLAEVGGRLATEIVERRRRDAA